ncbi:hypothetical protein [Tatumella ptyseos]|nr:hypothetical protein [Tatumella ptyseos]
MKKYDHFEEYEWIGLFWAETIPNESEISMEFPGKLTYSIENGVQLSFLYPAVKK